MSWKHAHEQGWHIGMDVCVVYRLNKREPDVRFLPITKIGRRWITIGEGWNADRFDAETCWIDGKGYGSPGKVYPSEADYIAETELGKAWTALHRSMPHTPPDGITLEQVKQIAMMIAEAKP